MEIERDIMWQLMQWKEKEGRKPLILRGARQVGKTWVLKKFGETCYDNTAYFNFDSSDELCREFEKTKDPKRLIYTLKLYTDKPIEPGKTLIIFDEIQQSNRALNSLKYFCEETPEYHIAAAGSLLGVALSHGDSFPVGKVDFLYMYPVTFKEFLRAENRKAFDYLDSVASFEELPEIIAGEATESYRRYMTCGGMPAATNAMLDGKGAEEIEYVLRSTLTAYTLDFAKHAPSKDIPRITQIWFSIPSQLSRENRKFLYRLVKDGARAREYEDSLLWLQQAGLIYKIFNSTKPGLPLSAFDDLSAFKIYLCDIGLLRSLAGLTPEIIVSQNDLYKEFKGAMSENAVLQALAPQLDILPRYWTSNGTAEVDFLIQHENGIVPVEVKSGNSVNSKSMAVYSRQYSPPRYIRFSMKNLRRDGPLLNIPLYMVDWTKKLLGNG